MLAFGVWLLEGNSTPHEIQKTIQKSEAIEDKVQEAADKLSVVNAALQREVP